MLNCLKIVLVISNESYFILLLTLHTSRARHVSKSLQFWMYI